MKTDKIVALDTIKDTREIEVNSYLSECVKLKVSLLLQDFFNYDLYKITINCDMQTISAILGPHCALEYC